MNELPTSDNKSDASSAAPTAASAISTNEQGARGANALRTYALLIGAFVVLALLISGFWWNTQQELTKVREDVAQRLRSSEAAFTETRVVVRSIQDDVGGLKAKVNILENKQSEAQSQQLALEQMYQDLARTRDDWILAEIEQVLSTASQQLQLAGNVQGAVIALQNADARLARSDTPQFVAVRRAIANDLERLKSLPSMDLTGVALRLDSAISQVDSMPLLADEKPVLAAVQPRESRQTAAVQSNDSRESDWFARIENAWHSWSNEMWSEIKQVIRVRNVETSDALLLSPTQAYYARENLKLRLLNARLALITRNETAFRSDLVAAQDAVGRYFDTRAKQTQTVQALLRQVQGSNLAIDMPTLAESLNALRNFKTKP